MNNLTRDTAPDTPTKRLPIRSCMPLSDRDLRNLAAAEAKRLRRRARPGGSSS